MKKILIVGGGGFVGSHTAEALLQHGHSVRVFDSLSKQVHRDGFPSYLSRDVEFIEGDVRNLDALSKAVVSADVIYHLAAAVGVGQSMYQIAEYADINIQGTANLLQAVLDTRSAPRKLIIASSMSIYGEGSYLCGNCGLVTPRERTILQLKERQWDLYCPACREILIPMPTAEDKALQCTSIYALSKKMQEEMALLFGRTYNIPVVALRYFNIYGPHQALSNPYTGVAAIFASRLMNAKSPVIFEDGTQMRDFVNVSDIVQANLLAISSAGGDGKALNIGSGSPVTVCQVAEEIASMLGMDMPVEISGRYRAGDIRHCYADIGAASRALGYKPRVTFAEGISQLVAWLGSQRAHDYTDEALQHLTVRGLVA